MKFSDLFKEAIQKNYEKGEVLHRPHEKCISLGYVQSGMLSMKKYLSSGKALSLTKFYPGEMYGELLVLAEENYRGWLIADEPATVLELNVEQLNNLLMEPSFKKIFFQRISYRVSTMTERMEILSYKKISDRIILYLLSHFDEGKEFEVNITTLAEELDFSREALSRAISLLENKEILFKNGHKLKIPSFPLLETQLSFN